MFYLKHPAGLKSPNQTLRRNAMVAGVTPTARKRQTGLPGNILGQTIKASWLATKIKTADGVEGSHDKNSRPDNMIVAAEGLG